MEELSDWLRHQNSSVRVFSQFCEKALAVRATEPQHAAMARLLANLAGNFSEAYYGEPLTLDVANRALARLAEIVARAVHANSAGPPQQMELLNEIGRMELN